MKRRTFLAASAFAPLAAPALVTAASEKPTVGGRSGTDHFPNVVLRTQRNEKVRFYDGLIKGKIAMLNFMYINCSGICPGMTGIWSECRKSSASVSAATFSCIR